MYYMERDSEAIEATMRDRARMTATKNGWSLTDLGIPKYVGDYNQALLTVEDERYRINVFTYSGQPILGGSYKTLNAALKNGRMYANSNYQHE